MAIRDEERRVQIPFLLGSAAGGLSEFLPTFGLWAPSSPLPSLGIF